MKCSIMTMCAIVTMSFIFPVSGIAEVYQFGGINMRHMLYWGATVNGNGAPISGGTVPGIEFYCQQSSMLWDVDSQNMTTTFLDARSSISSHASQNLLIKEGGFGGDYIPFTIHVENSSFRTHDSLGPCEVGQQLYFSMPTDGQTGTLSVTGYVDIGGQVFDFDISHELQPRYEWYNGNFDDTDYPQKLGLKIDRLFWDENDSIKISESMVGGHLVELSVFYWQVLQYSSDPYWEGQPVPEPCSLLLFTFSAMLMRRKLS